MQGGQGVGQGGDGRRVANPEKWIGAPICPEWEGSSVTNGAYWIPNLANIRKNGLQLVLSKMKMCAQFLLTVEIPNSAPK